MVLKMLPEYAKQVAARFPILIKLRSWIQGAGANGGANKIQAMQRI